MVDGDRLDEEVPGDADRGVVRRVARPVCVGGAAHVHVGGGGADLVAGAVVDRPVPPVEVEAVARVLAHRDGHRDLVASRRVLRRARGLLPQWVASDGGDPEALSVLVEDDAGVEPVVQAERLLVRRERVVDVARRPRRQVEEVLITCESGVIEVSHSGRNSSAIESGSRGHFPACPGRRGRRTSCRSGPSGSPARPRASSTPRCSGRSRWC